jgi:hypothetical protein
VIDIDDGPIGRWCFGRKLERKYRCPGDIGGEEHGAAVS